MTALFIVIFLEQWMEKKNRVPEIIGVSMAVLSVIIFGPNGFVPPAMLAIITLLFVGRKKLDKEEAVCR